jgi:hypothetical protein
VVGDGDGVAAEIGLPRTDQVLVEHLEPGSGMFLGPGEGALDANRESAAGDARICRPMAGRG